MFKRYDKGEKKMKQARSHRIGILSAVLFMALALAITGCGDNGSNGSGSRGATGDNVAFVLTTDFTSGSYSTIDLSTDIASKDLPAQTGIVESDNTGAYYNGRIYIINRYGADNITVLDKADPTVAINQFSTGNGTNPYAMAFKSDTEAYVCLYASNDLLVVDPTDAGDPIKERIDLSGFMAAGDTDGAVEAAAMVKVNDFLFVALQRLNNFVVQNDALLVVIDTTTNEIVDVDDSTDAVDAIVLTGRNPQFITYNADAGNIVVSETGAYFDTTDGGVETVDPISWEAEGFVVTETTLGGDLGTVAMVNANLGYAVIGGFSNNTVVAFDAAAGTKSADVVATEGFIPSLAIDSQDRLLVPDRTLTAPGIRIFDTSDNTEITTTPIDVGLPPNVILVY
jgi:hypothetical protein